MACWRARRCWNVAERQIIIAHLAAVQCGDCGSVVLYFIRRGATLQLRFCVRINLLASSPTFSQSNDMYSVWCARGLKLTSRSAQSS